MSSAGGAPSPSGGGGGGAYNPASVKVRVRVQAGGDRALPPGAGGGGGGPGWKGGTPWGEGTQIPTHPLTGGYPYTTLGSGKARGPVEAAQAIREAQVRDLYSQLDRLQKQQVLLMNMLQRRQRRGRIDQDKREAAAPYAPTPAAPIDHMYLAAEGISEEAFIQDRRLAEKEINRQRRKQTAIEDAALRRAETTFQKAHAAEERRIHREGRKERELAMQRSFQLHMGIPEWRHVGISREEKARIKAQEMEFFSVGGLVDYDELFSAGVKPDVISEILGDHPMLQQYAEKRLRVERRLRRFRTLTQRHSAYGAFFIASAQINPVQTLSRIALNSLIRSGPIGAAIGTTAAIGLSVEPVLKQTIKTFGQKGLPLNQDYHHFFSDQTVGFFTLEEQKRTDLGLRGVIADPAFGYEPVPGTSVYNNQQYATRTRLTKLTDLQKARRID